jgi:hypothetical protein
LVATSTRYTLSMEQLEIRDLKHISFDEFVSLIFQRDTPVRPDEIGPPFNEVDAEKLCAYYVRLFRQPEFLLSRFAKEQLEEGFWAIMGETHEWSAGNLIEYSDAPLASRKECIESMAVLFERLFVNERLDTSVHMWWDSLCYAWHCEIESGKTAAKIWNCRTLSSTRWLRFSPLTLGFARGPLFTA